MSDTVVLIVGGGVIGLSIGWTLAGQGVSVTVLERDKAGQGTTWLAAGMLAPAAEIGFEELDLYRLSTESLRRWPSFARAVEQASGQSVDYRDEGTLIVADDRDSAEALRRLYTFQKEHAAPVEWLTGAEALDLEPFLAPRLAAAVYSPNDHQVDNRRLVKALAVALQRAGGTLREQTRVVRVQPDADTPAVLTDEGQRLEGKTVILAAGVWSREVDGLAPYPPPIRPVKGQMLQLQAERPFDLRHVVRGPDAYLAPKSDGRLVIGATSEEMGFDTRVTAGGLYQLLEGAWTIVPGIYDLPVTDTWAGLRPASRDHAPLLGNSGLPGVIYATGHYRHGILLAPITAHGMARLVMHEETPDLFQPFAPQRFYDSNPSTQRP